MLDFHLLGDDIATRVIEFLSDKVKDYRVHAALVTGVFHSRALHEATRSAAQANGFDICLRISVSQLRQAGFSSVVRETLANLEVTPRNVHLLLDFGAMMETRPNLALPLDVLSRIGFWKSTTVLLGAFPKDLRNVEKNTQKVLERFDWATWRSFVFENPIAAPCFGDYTVQHGLYEEHEGQHFNFSASIRYTTDKGWVIMRGEGVLTEDGPGYAQWPANAQLLCEREEFSGEDFCFGDGYIERMSRQTTLTGTAKEWLAAGVNHHMTFAVRQLMQEFPSGTQVLGVVDASMHE